jgi:non-ribosomal peptide synthetase component F
LTLGVYEGGHHLRQNTGCGIDNQNAIGELFDRAVADPRMKDAYFQLLDGLVDADVAVFAHYHNTRQHDFDNRFGARRTLLEERTASPVYDALMTFIESAE